ncbi:MAG: tautomerase family protein [Pseudomonadota bacterium]
MPLYICNAKAGAVPEEAKAKIADDVTRIHCEVTDAPPTHVHVFHFADGPMPPLGDKSVMLYGQIRHGRTDAQKADTVAQMTASVIEHTGLSQDAIHVFTTDTPASWVMEGGDVLPEPGEEEEWLARQNAKMSQKA